MGFLSTIPAIASVAGGLFGKKKKGGDTASAQTLLPEFQLQTGQQLADFVSKYLKSYQPGKEYGGDMVAGLGSAELTGLNRLNEFLAAPELGNLYSGAKQNVLDTLSGRYADPGQSPFIQSMINLSRGNLRDLIDQSRAQRGARGTYFTKEGIEEEGRLAGQTQNYLDSVLGQFAESERGRQMQAIPLALGLEKYAGQDVPLSKISASQTFGSLPRLIEQAQLEADYGDFQRRQAEQSGVLNAGQALFGANTPYLPSYTRPVVQENNALGNILNMISKLNLGAMGGGGNIWDKIGGVLRG